jgi:hypothetical protein
LIVAIVTLGVLPGLVLDVLTFSGDVGDRNDRPSCPAAGS